MIYEKFFLVKRLMFIWVETNSSKKLRWNYLILVYEKLFSIVLLTTEFSFHRLCFSYGSGETLEEVVNAICELAFN